MEKTKHVASEECEFKLLLRRDAVTGGLSVAASSTGAWASSISLGVSEEGLPCCTAVISPAPDMQATGAVALKPEAEPEQIDGEALESTVIEQPTDEEPAAASAAAEPEEAEEPAPDQPAKAEKPAEKLEGRPFEEIAKGAAKKASDAKASGSKQASKPISGRQPSRTVTSGTQAAARR